MQIGSKKDKCEMLYPLNTGMEGSSSCLKGFITLRDFIELCLYIVLLWSTFKHFRDRGFLSSKENVQNVCSERRLSLIWTDGKDNDS